MQMQLGFIARLVCGIYIYIERERARTWVFGPYLIGEQSMLGRDCADAQSRQSIDCSYSLSIEVDEGSGQIADSGYM